MASRRERCNRCGHQAVTGQCPDCQAVTRFQPFEPQVHGPSAAGSHRFSRASNSIIPNMLAADGLDNNNFNGLQPFEPVVHAPGPRWFNRVSADINPNMVLLNNSFNNFVDQPRPWPPSAYGRKKALLCGVNYNGTSYKLSGCVNDVKGMRDSVVILTDFEVAILAFRSPSFYNLLLVITGYAMQLNLIYALLRL
ncbi:hypothetical protein CISIN_1g047533mg [Citrus sinensis]|uniref:Uncharacterized protein n=1 Tax=Citrus sinensis TaxID=2711 RepID=A0A067DI22_CITSI|nr:hypothetical protein CISIN_1g047533mg [Citrus sinensis]